MLGEQAGSYDCIMIAEIDRDQASALWSAYRNTVYTAVVSGRRLHIRVDQTSPGLDAELMHRRVTTWAFITAWNPRSQRLSSRENEGHQLDPNTNYYDPVSRSRKGEGKALDAASAAEASLLVFGIDEASARVSAESHGQLAIVVGKRHGSARLVASGGALWR
jgi:uncharacterized protein DUF3293